MSEIDTKIQALVEWREKLRKMEMELKHEQGKFGEAFGAFLKDNVGVSENFHLVDLIQKLWEKAA